MCERRRWRPPGPRPGPRSAVVFGRDDLVIGQAARAALTAQALEDVAQLAERISGDPTVCAVTALRVANACRRMANAAQSGSEADAEVGVLEPVRSLGSASDVLSDPTSSTWLREALRSAMDRDPVDAAHDAEALSTLLQARALRLLEESLDARPSGGVACKAR